MRQTHFTTWLRKMRSASGQKGEDGVAWVTTSTDSDVRKHDKSWLRRDSRLVVGDIFLLCGFEHFVLRMRGSCNHSLTLKKQGGGILRDMTFSTKNIRHWRHCKPKLRSFCLPSSPSNWSTGPIFR